MPAPRKRVTQPRSPETAKRLTLVTTEPDPKANWPAAPKDLLPESVEAWDAVWQMPQAKAFEGAHRLVLVRWVSALDEWFRSMEAVRGQRFITGSQGQPVANPLMAWVTSREVEMEKCERQLGVGLRNAADLGVSAGQAKLTAAQLNAMTRRELDGSGDKGKKAAAVDAEGWEAV